MTRAQIERTERAVAKPCAGFLHPEGLRLKQILADKGRPDLMPIIDQANRMRRSEEPFVTAVTNRAGEGFLAYLSDGSREPYAPRPRCGFDYRELIIAGPFDGKPHAYTCPQCGVQGEYIAPKAEGEE